MFSDYSQWFPFLLKDTKVSSKVFVSLRINSITSKSFTGHKTHLKKQGGLSRKVQKGAAWDTGMKQRSQADLACHGPGSADVLLVLSSAWTIPYHCHAAHKHPCCHGGVRGAWRQCPHSDFQIIQVIQIIKLSKRVNGSVTPFGKPSISLGGNCGY